MGGGHTNRSNGHLVAAFPIRRYKNGICAQTKASPSALANASPRSRSRTLVLMKDEEAGNKA